ncbi:putative 54s ribosomal protein l7 protein [Phaeoacremonium minimum UCRPA7]|uniref:Putative 54s ribosomal protein l7 protein n=1 Tax=Phaeoacremonium minimum (strain UCR-PA7) TaxID=1286976 RepID=R8BBP1_PHAM7|nr:putative 54s ribosomal protein l7 protein [Phaeoacremonium minimum UCRPA7]EON96689.1 putative 54s ribosomal protein l7 protein [Phaeoacremonium minimum UCRPA7]
MTLTYDHKPPGTERQVIGQRLREWDESSPYHKGRPLRSPRGNPTLTLVERDINFRNIPEVRAVTLSSYVPAALKNEDFLLVARAAMQAITGSVPETVKTRKSVAQWGIAEGKKSGVKTTIYGNAAYEFLDKCVHLVFPRIKDWPGLKGSTGDSSGNLSFGLTHENMALFPEIEVNYDIYPPKMLPGCRVFVETTANSDRQARLLFQALGFPFYGRLRN